MNKHATSHLQPPTPSSFGRLPDGRGVDLFTLRNARGVEVRVMTCGAIITSLLTPDRAGAFDDIVLGFETLEPYLSKRPYFGCVVGRYANRIARGRFELDGHVYTLATNNGVNHLHGGTVGWDRALWSASPFRDASGAGVRMRHRSPDGDEGYPGAVDAEVVYTLTDGNDLIVDYRATTDRPTVISMTQHAYFNLAGARANTIVDHEVTIHADRYTPVDDPHEQLQRARGYDHNYVLRGDGVLTPAARVVEPLTGRTLTVATTEPGVQFYSGNMLDGSITGKGGRVCGFRSALCLETQHFPDSPNHPNFPSTVLRPGQEYRSKTVFGFA